MHEIDFSDSLGPAACGGRNGVYLAPDDIDRLARLLREVRELTLSRQTFMSASDLLRRLAGETSGPSLVASDSLDL